ncbi:MAG: YbgC/FadM family acyl-CoA thioesterase [Thalassotalea sp.]
MVENKHNFAVRIYYEDTDAGGIVYYANYLKFAERARTEWLRALGMNQSYLLANNRCFVIRKVTMNNIASARLDDQLSVVSIISQVKKASLCFYQEIFNQDDIKLCTIDVLVAFIDISSTKSKPCALPSEILGALPSVS